MMVVLRLLRRGRAVLSVYGWCSGSFARDCRGQECSVHDDKACMFCAVGAIDRAVGKGFGSQGRGIREVCERARELLWLSVPARDEEMCIESFNDNSDFAGVKALYDRAIRYALEAFGPGSV